MSVATSKVDRQLLANRLSAKGGEVNEALAAILLMLWDEEEFDERVAAKHAELCAQCPARKLFEESPSGGRRQWGVREVLEIVKYALVVTGIAVLVVANLTGTKVPSLPSPEAAAESRQQQ